MNREFSHDDFALWHRIVESYETFSLALIEFSSGNVDRVALMHTALRGKDRATALHLLRYLEISELTQLFEDLIFLASFSHGAIQTVRDIILSLPREWVLANIEEVAEPLLRDGTYDEYRRLLELYIQMDNDLTLRLARIAAEHTDLDIREAGTDFLRRVGLQGKTT